MTARLKRDNDGYQCPTVPHFITPAAIKPSLSDDDLCQLRHRAERDASVRLLLGEQLDSWWHYSFYQLGLSQDAVENLLTFAGVTHAYKHGCAELVLEGLIQVSFSPWQEAFAARWDTKPGLNEGWIGPDKCTPTWKILHSAFISGCLRQRCSSAVTYDLDLKGGAISFSLPWQKCARFAM